MKKKSHVSRFDPISSISCSVLSGSARWLLSVFLLAATLTSGLFQVNNASATTIPTKCRNGQELPVHVEPVLHSRKSANLPQEAVDPAGVIVTSGSVSFRSIIRAVGNQPDTYSIPVSIKNVQDVPYFDVYLLIEFAKPNDALTSPTPITGLHDIGHDAHASCGSDAPIPAYSYGNIPPGATVTRIITLTRDANSSNGGPGKPGSTSDSLTLRGCGLVEEPTGRRDALSDGIPDRFYDPNGIVARSAGIISLEGAPECSEIFGTSNVSVVLSLTPETAVSLKKVGGAADAQRSNVVISGQFTADTNIDLRMAALTIFKVLDGVKGAGELAGGAVLPVDFFARNGGNANKALFETSSSERPSFRMEIKRRSGNVFDFTLKVTKTHITVPPQFCTGDPPTIDLATSFSIDDGVNPPVVFETVQAWECDQRRDGTVTKLELR